MEDRRAPQNEQDSLVVDTPIELWELDYSVLLGHSPNTDVVLLCSDQVREGQNVVFGGKTYTAVPVQGRGFDLSLDGAPPRPSVEIANGMGLVSSLIRSVGDLSGALVHRRRVFRRHLDDGEDPDSTAEWEPQVWRIERKVRDDFFVEFELTAKIDGYGMRIPGRVVEWNICSWTYESEACGWVPGVGPYFKKSGVSTVNLSEDDCGLRLSDCKLRFLARSQALRYGGFPAVVRVVK